MRFLLVALLCALSYAQTDLGYCGMVGGNSVYDNVNADTFQQFMDNRINWYWNWDTKRVKNDGPFPSTFMFVPTLWGNSGTVTPQPNMANIVFGWNEPDIAGMCQGICDMSTPPKCDYTHVGWNPECLDSYGLGPLWCDPANPDMKAFPSAQPTGLGYWPFQDGINGFHCPDANGGDVWTNTIRKLWDQTWNSIPSTFQITAPMLADGADPHWIKRFTQAISPGQKPKDLVFHWYGNGCPQNTTSSASIDGFSALVAKLDNMVDLIGTDYPGAKIWITEIGLLQTGSDGKQTCPPETLTWVMDQVFDLFSMPKYTPHIAHICWFGTHSVGNTFDTAVVNKDGTINSIGKNYIKRCKQMDDMKMKSHKIST